MNQTNSEQENGIDQFSPPRKRKEREKRGERCNDQKTGLSSTVLCRGERIRRWRRGELVVGGAVGGSEGVQWECRRRRTGGVRSRKKDRQGEMDDARIRLG